jgi:lauroyl/myristoyl acyltransferase
LSGEQNRFVDAVINQVRHQFNFSPLHTHRERADDLFTATKQQKTTTTKTTKTTDRRTD